MVSTPGTLYGADREMSIVDMSRFDACEAVGRLLFNELAEIIGQVREAAEMQVKDEEIFRIIEQLGDHYKSNISNRIMRKALLKMDLDNATWDRVERLTEISDYQRMEGYSFHELYEQVLAMALFVNYAQHRLLPNLRGLLTGDESPRFGGGTVGANDKVLRDMAINNFRSNLGILSDIVNDLYLKTVELDKHLNGEQNAVYSRMPELRQLGQLLI